MPDQSITEFMQEQPEKQDPETPLPANNADPALPTATITTEAVPEPETSPLPETEIINPSTNNQPSNEPSMEVHTHGHVHETKKWKEYLFQFLMLFLAVTAGFFAENQREHYVENHRAHRLAESLIQDLEADTAEVTMAGERMRMVARMADSLIQQLNKPRQQQNDSLLQVGIYRLAGYNFYDPQMGTYQQIKSSGSLRYFKTDISQKLTRYENSTDYIGRLTDELVAFRTHTLLPFLMDIQNGRFAAALESKRSYTGSFFMREPATETLDYLYNRAVRLRTLFNWYVERIGDHRKRADELIVILRKEYDLGQ